MLNVCAVLEQSVRLCCSVLIDNNRHDIHPLLHWAVRVAAAFREYMALLRDVQSAGSVLPTSTPSAPSNTPPTLPLCPPPLNTPIPIGGISLPSSPLAMPCAPLATVDGTLNDPPLASTGGYSRVAAMAADLQPL